MIMIFAIIKQPYIKLMNSMGEPCLEPIEFGPTAGWKEVDYWMILGAHTNSKLIDNVHLMLTFKYIIADNLIITISLLLFTFTLI